MKCCYLAQLILGAALVASLGVSPVFAQAKPDVSKPLNETIPPAATSTQPSKDAGVGAAIDPNKYLIGPEDVLHVTTWREPDFSMVLAVRPDGKISMPLINDVQASGLTPMQLTSSLKEKIGKYVNNPSVTVIVQDVRSKKYFIDGEVLRSGAYALVTPTTVLEALSICGGFKEFANEKRIRILRGGKSYMFNYKDVVRGKHTEQNIFIENGDHIIVP